MEPSYIQNFKVNDLMVDCFGRLRPSAILFFAQEVAGQHCNTLQLDYDTLQKRDLFWAVIRHRVQITRLPSRGETIRVETWPLPTTRSAYPRSVVAYDEQGNECFRSISLWVLMDRNTRNMILPGKSGIVVSGTCRGTELAAPASLVPAKIQRSRNRTVSFTDLDRNGHMNNTRYLDWIYDLLPGSFHMEHPIREFTICYHSEAREGKELSLHGDFLPDGSFQVDSFHDEDGQEHRTFSAKLFFE